MFVEDFTFAPGIVDKLSRVKLVSALGKKKALFYAQICVNYVEVESIERNCLCWKGGFMDFFAFMVLKCTCWSMPCFFFLWQFSCYAPHSANQLSNTPLMVC